MSICSRRDCARPAKWRGLCESDYRRQIRKGLFGLVDPAPVLAHLDRLRELGWTWEQIADAAGTSTSTAHGLHVGRYRRVRREVARALLAIPAVPRASHRGRSALGTQRRMRALAWMGWSAPMVAKRIGIPAGTLPTLIGRGRVSARLAAQVAQVYREWSHLPGPSKQSRTKALSKGWAPPAAWDDNGANGIDDPRARPSGVTDRRVA